MTDRNEAYFQPDPHRSLVHGEHEIATIIEGDIEVPVGAKPPEVEMFGLRVMYDGTNVSVVNPGYIRPVARFDPGTYDDVSSFISDCYGWRLELNLLSRREKREAFSELTHDPDKADRESFAYVPR